MFISVTTDIKLNQNHLLGTNYFFTCCLWKCWLSDVCSPISFFHSRYWLVMEGKAQVLLIMSIQHYLSEGRTDYEPGWLIGMIFSIFPVTGISVFCDQLQNNFKNVLLCSDAAFFLSLVTILQFYSVSCSQHLTGYTSWVIAE